MVPVSDLRGQSPAEAFGFEVGDTVQVTVREHRTSGPITAKFEAECVGFREGVSATSPTARLELPFGMMNSVTLREYEAEFEVIE